MLIKKSKPIKPTFNKNRPLSWSGYSSFLFDPEQWYRKYVLNIQDPPSREMIFGKEFAKSIEDGTPLFNAPVTVYDVVEMPFDITFSDIPMVGYADTFCSKTKKRLREFKTGKKAWDQKRADDHGQITFYALFNFITNKIKPEDMTFHLDWYPTYEKDDFSIDFVRPIVPVTFQTKRTMADILKMGAEIKRVYKEMQTYCEGA